MPLYAKEASSANSHSRIPEGQYIATITKVIHYGEIESTYNGESSRKDKIKISFETNKTYTDDEGIQKNYGVNSSKMSFYFSPNSKITRYTKSLFPSETPDHTFDMERLLGMPCLVAVEHKSFIDDDGKKITYATVTNVMALPDGMPKHEPTVEPFLYTVTDHDDDKFSRLHEADQKLIQSSKQRETHVQRKAEEGLDKSDELPF